MDRTSRSFRSQAWAALGCAAAILAFAAPSLASSWFPLATGRVWILEDGATRKVVANEASETGELAFTDEAHPSGLNFETRWRTDRDGSVYVLGYVDLEGPFTFDPPLLWLPADPKKGDEWTNRAERLNSDGKPVGLIEHTRRVAGDERLDFRWGSVDAMRVESIGDRLPLASISLQDTDPARTPWVIYYVRDLGMVRRGRDDVPWIDVIGFGTGFVRNDVTSWGAWKSWYGGDPD